MGIRYVNYASVRLCGGNAAPIRPTDQFVSMCVRPFHDPMVIDEENYFSLILAVSAISLKTISVFLIKAPNSSAFK